MLLSAALMALLTFTDLLAPTGVLALTFMLGIGAALTTPAWWAIQPDLVPKEHFAQAVSLGSMTYNVGRAIGPAIGGFIIAAAGTEWVFAINAVVLRRHDCRDLGVEAAAPQRQPIAVRDARRGDGCRTALQRQLAQASQRPDAGAVAVRRRRRDPALLPIVVRGPLDWSSGGYGILLGCFGIGATISAILRPRIVHVLDGDPLMLVNCARAGRRVDRPGLRARPGRSWRGAVRGRLRVEPGGNSTTIAAQSALPSWVRARGMALYAFVLAGSFAIGSELVWLRRQLEPLRGAPDRRDRDGAQPTGGVAMAALGDAGVRPHAGPGHGSGGRDRTRHPTTAPCSSACRTGCRSPSSTSSAC